jgi:hypothetical protein
MALGLGPQFNFNQTLKKTMILTTNIETCNCDGAPKSYQANYIDNNHNFRYDAGDSVILSDTNKDGKYDYKDAEETSKLLNLMRNRKDPNLDASNEYFGAFGSSDQERKEAQALSPKLSLIDGNRDGIIGASELGSGCVPKNLRLAHDLNGDGQFTGEDFNAERTQNLQFIEQGGVAGVAVPRVQGPSVLKVVGGTARAVVGSAVKTVVTGHTPAPYHPAINPHK